MGILLFSLTPRSLENYKTIPAHRSFFFLWLPKQGRRSAAVLAAILGSLPVFPVARHRPPRAPKAPPIGCPRLPLALPSLPPPRRPASSPEFGRPGTPHRRPWTRPDCLKVNLSRVFFVKSPEPFLYFSCEF